MCGKKFIQFDVATDVVILFYVATINEKSGKFWMELGIHKYLLPLKLLLTFDYFQPQPQGNFSRHMTLLS